MTGPATRSPGVRAQVARVARLVWAERRPYLAGTLFIAVSIVTGLAYPQVIRLLIDDAMQGGQAGRLNELSIWLVGLLLAEAISTGMRDYCFGEGAERVGVRLRRLVFRTLLSQDIRFFDKRDVGEITARLNADVLPLEHVLGEDFADSLRSGVFSVCGTLLLFYTAPRPTLLTMLAVPPVVMASVLGRRKTLAAVCNGRMPGRGFATEVLAGSARCVRSQEATEIERAFGRWVALDWPGAR